MARWLKPVSCIFCLAADILLLFSAVLHLDWVYVSGSFYRFITSGYQVVEAASVIVLVLFTVLLYITGFRVQYPSKITCNTMIGHDVIMLVTFLIIYFNDASGVYFPYQVLIIIPFLSSILSLVFLFYDSIRIKTPKEAPAAIVDAVHTFSATTREDIAAYVETEDSSAEKKNESPKGKGNHRISSKDAENALHRRG